MLSTAQLPVRIGHQKSLTGSSQDEQYEMATRCGEYIDYHTAMLQDFDLRSHPHLCLQRNCAIVSAVGEATRSRSRSMGTKEDERGEGTRINLGIGAAIWPRA